MNGARPNKNGPIADNAFMRAPDLPYRQWQDSKVRQMHASRRLLSRPKALLSGRASPVDETCLQRMQNELREPACADEARAVTATTHPFSMFLGGPPTGESENPIALGIDLE